MNIFPTKVRRKDMNIKEALCIDERVIVSEKSIEEARDNLFAMGAQIDETVSNDKFLLIFVEKDRWKTVKITEEGIELSRKRHT